MTDTPATRTPRQEPNSDARPPCSGCAWRTGCEMPRRCKPFQLYVKTGRQIMPPLDRPW